MLDMAGVGAGARVLDVAAGAGGQTLAAARRVGPSGSVLATDI
jgi:ubiquinone/menaquinone biosynthesis C-methylase UbiE